MSENRVSATISEADRQAVLAAIETIRQKLSFLIDLTPEQRRSLPKMGDKSRAFVSKALAVAQHNSNFLPRSFSVEEMERDVALAEALMPIMVSLTRLQEQVLDTYTEVGSEAYSAALVVYQYARTSGEGESLETLLDDMAQRFARKSKSTKPPSS
ncbi:MAG: hypothetical protein QOJ70_1302 [Acidobacteriota bacterium]|jgi:hypothetical protein|nr:hypothetical protein [Acidobacteriota bacterium]